MMKNVSHQSKLILIVLFSLSFLVLPAYLYFSNLGDLDITTFYICLENIDREDSIPGLEKNEKILELAFLIKQILIAHLSLARIPNLSCQLPILDSTSLILRC